MYIVPILVKSNPNTNLKQIWLFLERNGNHLIHLDATDDTALVFAKKFLALNEMETIGEPIIIGDTVFASIDPSSKELSSFYTWREVSPGTIPSKDVWRSFLWLSYSDSSDPLGTNRLLDTISLTDQGHNVYSVISSYLKTSY
jgi:hypothetical protein